MKKLAFYALAAALLSIQLGCQKPAGSAATPAGADTTAVDSPKQDIVAAPVPESDSAKLMAKSREILALVEAKDFVKLADFIHPEQGLRFSPYTSVDEGTDKLFEAQALRDHIAKNPTKKLMWGTYDPSGEPIRLTLEAYCKEFVCDKPYLTKGRFAYNETIGNSNIINNIAEFYPDAVFVEANWQNEDEEKAPYDWGSIRLVFEKSGTEYYLVGLVHDQWAT